MYVERLAVPITTDASGNGTGYTPVVRGRILDIQYVPDGSTPYDSTVDLTVTGEISGKAILTKSNIAAAFTLAPREATCDVSAAAALYAAGGTAVNDYIPVHERVKLVLAQGGNVKTGTFYVTIEGISS